MKGLRRHLSPANLLSCLALFVALSGAAYAAGLARNSVKARNIARNAVTTPKLKKGAVTTAKLRNGAVTGAKLAEEAVTGAKLAKASVRSVTLGGGVVTTPKLKDAAVSGAKLQDGAVSDGKLSASLLGQLVKNVSYASKSSDVDATSPKTVTSDCPAGKQVVGGGGRPLLGTSAEASLISSIPFLNAEGKRSGWRVTAAGAAGTFAVEAVAICAEL